MIAVLVTVVICFVIEPVFILLTFELILMTEKKREIHISKTSNDNNLNQKILVFI